MPLLYYQCKQIIGVMKMAIILPGNFKRTGKVFVHPRCVWGAQNKGESTKRAQYNIA